jgi:hypothetical protein
MNKARINDFIEELIELSDKFGIYIGQTNDSAGYRPILYDIYGKCIAEELDYRSPEEEDDIKDCYSYDYHIEYGAKVRTPMGIGIYLGKDYHEKKVWAHVKFENDSAVYLILKDNLECVE